MLNLLGTPLCFSGFLGPSVLRALLVCRRGPVSRMPCGSLVMEADFALTGTVIFNLQWRGCWQFVRMMC